MQPIYQNELYEIDIERLNRHKAILIRMVRRLQAENRALALAAASGGLATLAAEVRDGLRL